MGGALTGGSFTGGELTAPSSGGSIAFGLVSRVVRLALRVVFRVVPFLTGLARFWFDGPLFRGFLVVFFGDLRES